MPPEEKDEIVEEEREEPEVKEPSSIEEIAKKIGWNPSYDGSDGREPLSAEDFILKSKEIQSTSSKQIKKYSREVQELKNGFKNLEEHNKVFHKAQVAQLKREIADLKTRRKEADEDGDNELVKELDGHIKDMSDIPTELPQSTSQLHPDFQAWVDDNEWYQKDEDLRAYADMLGEQPEYRALAGSDYKGMLGKVEASVRKLFPQKFNDPVRTVSSVEPNTRTAPRPRSKKWSYNELSRDQQDMADFYERQGIMTKDKYIEELQTISEAS